MALRLREIEPRDYTYLITPTGNELPEMVDHWKRIAEMLETPLTVISRKSLQGIIRDNNMIPNFRARFCTRILKLEPFKAYLLKNMPAVGYVGLRADEAEREGVSYQEEEIQQGLTQRFPLSEWGWGIRDVMGYLNGKGVSIPRRTDCALCFFQRIGEWWNMWRDHPDYFQEGIDIEESMGYTFRTPGKDTWPIELKNMRRAFDEGYVPQGASTQDDLFEEKDRIAEAKCRMCSI